MAGAADVDRPEPTGDALLRVEPRSDEGRVDRIVVELDGQDPSAGVRVGRVGGGSAAPSSGHEQLAITMIASRVRHGLGLYCEKTAQTKGAGYASTPFLTPARDEFVVAARHR
jgi:hypothetical protein